MSKLNFKLAVYKCSHFTLTFSGDCEGWHVHVKISKQVENDTYCISLIRHCGYYFYILQFALMQLLFKAVFVSLESLQISRMVGSGMYE